MAEQIPADEQANYETFRECLSEPVLRVLAAPMEKPKQKKKKRSTRKAGKKVGKDVKTEDKDKGEETKEVIEHPAEEEDITSAEDLSDFIDYLATQIFPSLPSALRTLSYATYTDTPKLQETYALPLPPRIYTPILQSLPPTFLETATSSTLLPSPPDLPSLRNLLLPVLTAYITATTAPPPIWSTTRTSACELCNRDWVPLTYHHLIPRSTHERVRKRGWHREEALNSVAWLCRACHNFVHRLVGNEELARGFYTVELIKEGGVQGDGEKRGEVERWVEWVGGVRWKSR